MNIVYILTRNFCELALPSMRSVLDHNPKAKIYLLTEGQVDLGIPMTVIDISGQTYFTRENCINFRNNFGGPINLLKVCYPELLKVNKVIHLDADTIVCDSLEPVWKTDLSGKWVGMVQEYQGQYRPFGPVYYNAGVMILNLAQMRKDKTVPEMVEYLRSVRQPFADQDAFNRNLDKVVPLDLRYNENFATGETDNPAIVHFCGYQNWYHDTRIPRHKYLEQYL